MVAWKVSVSHSQLSHCRVPAPGSSCGTVSGVTSSQSTSSTWTNQRGAFSRVDQSQLTSHPSSPCPLTFLHTATDMFCS